MRIIDFIIKDVPRRILIGLQLKFPRTKEKFKGFVVAIQIPIEVINNHNNLLLNPPADP